MANWKQIELLKRGMLEWNKWRVQHPEIGVDLRGADLYGTDLSGADLSDADLHGADLGDANLSHTNLNGARLNPVILSHANVSHAVLVDANLSGAWLSHANLSRADLSGANLSEARLFGANLKEARLISTNLSGANLFGANLQGAVVWKTVFTHVDLREVRRLVDLNHLGPSHVELQTSQLPQDDSALCFLRDTGVPDQWLDLYRAEMMHPIQYYSCFISYSSKDEILARRLHADLQAQGVRCWFAPHDMKIGDKLRTRINQVIHQQEKLLLLLSEHAIESGWVEDEVEIAYIKEREQRREVLFPVKLDEVVMATSQAWAKTLRDTRHIGDFTHWLEPEAYQEAFERLLRDLKKVNGEISLPDGRDIY